MPEELTLLPCPACGHPAGIARANGTGCAFVMCQHVKCAFSGPIKTTSEAAVAAWNALPRALEWTSRRRCRGGTGSRMNMAYASHGSSMTLVK